MRKDCSRLDRIMSHQRRLHRHQEYASSFVYLPPNQLLIPLFAFAAPCSTDLSNLSMALLISLPVFELRSLALASASASLVLASADYLLSESFSWVPCRVDSLLDRICYLLELPKPRLSFRLPFPCLAARSLSGRRPWRHRLFLMSEQVMGPGRASNAKYLRISSGRPWDLHLRCRGSSPHHQQRRHREE